MTPLTPDMTILGLIAIQSCHGYELVESFHRSADLGDVWKMSTSQVYAVLKRLERQHLITGQVIEVPDAPRRTEYRLTDAGEQRLYTWLHDPVPSPSIRRVRVEFLSRLYIARQLNIPTAPIVRRQRAACAAERARLTAAQAESAVGISYLAQALVIAQLDAVLGWIQRCELVPDDREDEE
ncbi:MAG: PadR family transcriptional regulator [Chloroflexota bacterium]